VESGTSCAQCEALRLRVTELETECALLRAELDETLTLSELQQKDLERYKQAYEAGRPNHPERVPRDELQLAFEHVLDALGPSQAVNDVRAQDEASSSENDAPDRPPRGRKRRHRHGRRKIRDLEHLEKVEVNIQPPEVIAAEGKGFKWIGDEVATRVARRPASYVQMIIRRGKYVRIDQGDEENSDPSVTISCSEDIDSSPVIVAPLPDSVWPNFMADASAIAHVIVSKYDDILPLHRQERISARDGFALPRSTQCGWLAKAHEVTYRIVDAMFEDAKAHAFCIATDATGAPVRAPSKCESWDVFVFLADCDHVVFRHVQQKATSDKMKDLLAGFRGHLLADALSIYDALYESGDIIENACWYHCRRNFYRALETEKALALEPLALISKLFEVNRTCSAAPDTTERTAERARRAKPLLELLDKWVEIHRGKVDPRGPLDKAIGYYENQRVALHRFIEDCRIRLSNNLSEQQLRNLAQGRDNWNFFANETGVRWYTTFRSLIASCRLHELNCATYLEEILRLAPHWPVTRVLDLAPKYWTETRKALDARQRAIITRPWEFPGRAPFQTPTSSRAPPLSLAR